MVIYFYIRCCKEKVKGLWDICHQPKRKTRFLIPGLIEAAYFSIITAPKLTTVMWM